MTDATRAFEKLFRAATTRLGEEPSRDPAPCQIRLALDPRLPATIELPAGADPIETMLLAWLWRRRFGGPEVRDRTPRRLVFCVPGKADAVALRDRAREVLRRLDLLAVGPASRDGIAVSTMGAGEVGSAFPGRETVVAGVADELFRRCEWVADALWVLDGKPDGAAGAGADDVPDGRSIRLVSASHG